MKGELAGSDFGTLISRFTTELCHRAGQTSLIYVIETGSNLDSGQGTTSPLRLE